MFLFFSSIILLILRNSSLSLIIGWEGLGLTSLFLVIFFPGKYSLFNSFLTMVFNRLGDRIIIIVLRIQVFFPSFSFSLIDLTRIFFALVLCSLTKRAQFPLSSWLPAAISAPTPISAMVHSSTLVTAGIFILFKLEIIVIELDFNTMFQFLRISSFLLGGLLALFEQDLKKVVAFSTIRQIRIIFVLTYFSLFPLSMTHMFIHASFKRLLFCSCGFLFTSLYGDQNLIASKSLPLRPFLSFLLFLSVYEIRGVIFSRSFFTKDLGIEILWSEYYFFNFFIIFLGRILTLAYCSKLLECLIPGSFNIKTLLLKSSHNIIFIFFATILLLIRFNVCSLIPMGRPLLTSSVVIFLRILFFFVIIFRYSLSHKKRSAYLSKEVGLMKS